MYVCMVCVHSVSTECLPGLSPTSFFETGSLAESGAKLNYPASPKDLLIPGPLVLGLQTCCLRPHLWYRVVGSELKSSCLSGMYFTERTVSPAPYLFIFLKQDFATQP